MIDFLKDVRIVSFTHFLFGPMGVQTLADLGADVIAVEPLSGSWQRSWGGEGNKMVDGQSVLFLSVDRNKRSIAVDLKSPHGYEITRKLLASADVMASNYRPGVLDKLGFGYEELKKDNPGLIYAAASGYGPNGPYVKRPGQDLLIQAMSGLAAINGPKGTGPRPVGLSAADHHGAALLALGIVTAEPLVSFLNGKRPETVTPPKYIGGFHYEAPYGIYPAKDGHIAISLTSLKTLNEALSSEDLAAFDDSENYEKREEIAECIARAIETKSVAEWQEILDKYGIWHQPVNDYAAVADDPQVRHNNCLVTVQGATGSDITLVNHPIRYDGAAPEVRLPPQPVSAQANEILRELGYSDNEIDRLKEEKVVG
jgi:crotonobetainyl-CoA:carnitine CoA-transferase CaiB-like acyl-CoA transferase